MLILLLMLHITLIKVSSVKCWRTDSKSKPRGSFSICVIFCHHVCAVMLHANAILMYLVIPKNVKAKFLLKEIKNEFFIFIYALSLPPSLTKWNISKMKPTMFSLQVRLQTDTSLPSLQSQQSQMESLIVFLFMISCSLGEWKSFLKKYILLGKFKSV